MKACYCLLPLLITCGPALYGAERPNVVVILADDIGYGDLGCYGASKVKTPNLDRLAREGLRLLDAHSPAAVCTPTRYALLTGQYAWRHAPGSRILSGAAPLSIPVGTTTAATLFRDAGYATGSVGKWHLGLGEGLTNYNSEIKPGPREVGFDYSFLIPATGDRVPCVYVENHRVVGYDPADPIQVSYGTPLGSEPTGAKNPELLRVKHSHGHDNTIINGIGRIGFMTGGKAARWKDEDMADTITQKAVAFLEKNQRRPFFLYFAPHDVHVPRVPHSRFVGTSQHGTRGDVIHELDWSVGQVLETLDRLNLTQNTLVIFTSDNGGVMDDGYQDGSGSDASGHRCNGDLRGYKGRLYEGGHRVPFLARWPGRVPAGKVSSELVCHVDLLATFSAMLDQPLPAAAGPDSFSMLPALLNEKPSLPCRDHLISQGGYVGGLALRQGPWKLIITGAQKAKPAYELYNLDADPREAADLAAKEPQRVKKMAADLEKARQDGRTRPAKKQPNIVFLLADDLGAADVSWREGEIKTPNLDKLALAGARLDSFYVQPVCSPTRAALMTGRYPMRHGLQVGVVRPWAQYGLPLEERTLSQALHDAGYLTAIVGKWHLGHFEPAYLPTRRGFDLQYGHYNGALDYYTKIRDGGYDWHRQDKVCRDEGYSTHLLAKEAASIIEKHGGDKPLFLYVPFNAVHAPHQVPESYMKPYAHLQGQRRIYAGMLAAMDEAVGKIVAAIDAKGLRDNTLFVFSSDNGGPAPGKVTSNGKLRAAKGTVYEGGVRVPAFAAWQGKIKPGSVVNEPLHMVDWYPTLLRLGGASLAQPLPVDGLDAWEAIAQGKPSPHDAILINTSPRGGALRAGKWKLVVNGNVAVGDDVAPAQAKEPAKVELFDLAADPYEKSNVAAQHPEKVRELRKRLDDYAKQAVPPKVKSRPAGFQVPKVWGEKGNS